MPDIHFECPKCAQTIDAPEELATQLIECPTCKETIEVPVRTQRKEAPKPPELPKPAPVPPTPTLTTPPKFSLPPIEDSVVSMILTFIAALEFLGSIAAGFIVGSENTEAGVLFFVGGIVSGLILIGFATVIQNTYESSQRLRRLELLMERDYDRKPAA
jgi:hypothetical protein